MSFLSTLVDVSSLVWLNGLWQFQHVRLQVMAKDIQRVQPCVFGDLANVDTPSSYELLTAFKL
jgi:hypothetical protein